MAWVTGSVRRAKSTAVETSFRPSHHRATPRITRAIANGDPKMTLPLVGSPSAKSIVFEIGG